ncbi:ATP-binding protein [Eubacterium sp. 1001713B170207_170306_E7]|uniref:ATP-binding protein n=1 Tax=Eubacterium sp. 1001713B170207_170306_E7 TaxID=2787097 RepID=UPI0018979D6E|nr:ATP-binding protein [Eubacterium sp. 1001713B170207_170306_E7]
MLGKDKRVRIIAGHYGSGKTEFAVNYAVALSQKASRVVLADLDIVNVFFRSRERRKELEEYGVSVIGSSIEQDNCDLPAISAEIGTPVKDKACDYIIDLGGNSVGTTTLARLRPLLSRDEVDFFMVVNVNRPDTASVEGILLQKESLEYASGFQVTGFINNTNFVRESTLENLIAGDAVLRDVSQRTGVPIRYTSYMEEILGSVPEKLSGERLPLKFFMREEWM